MRKFIDQSCKAFCYMSVYLGSQIIVSFAFLFIYGIMIGLEAGMNGTIPDANTMETGIMDFVNKYTNLINVISGIITLLGLWLAFLILKKKFATQVYLNKINKKKIVPIIILGFVLNFFISGVLIMLPTSDNAINSYVESSSWLEQGNLIIRILSVVVAAPIVEEVIFRGLIYTRLRCAMKKWIAILLSSLIFGLFHGDILWISYAFILGIILAIVADRHNSIIASIILHMSFNSVSLVSEYLVYPEKYNIFITIGTFILSVMLLIIIVKKNRNVEVLDN